MKKFWIIVLLMAYGFSSTGMTVNLHYCCGKLKSIDWSPAKEKDCGSGHKMGTKPCCETKTVGGKEKSDQEQVLFVPKQVKAVSEALPPLPLLAIERGIQQPLSPVAFAPPPLYLPPLFILHCVYRI